MEKRLTRCSNPIVMSENPEVDEYEFHTISRSRKIWYTFSSIVIVFAAGFILLAIFWMVYPYKTAEIKTPVPILNENNEIARGDTVLLKVVVTKYTDVAPERDELITCDDGSITFINPGDTTNLPPGTYTFTNDKNTLPEKLVVGAVCKYHFRYSYRVNPIREINKEWDSEPFTVVGRTN